MAKETKDQLPLDSAETPAAEPEKTEAEAPADEPEQAEAEGEASPAPEEKAPADEVVNTNKQPDSKPTMRDQAKQARLGRRQDQRVAFLEKRMRQAELDNSLSDIEQFAKDEPAVAKDIGFTADIVANVRKRLRARQ